MTDDDVLLLKSIREYAEKSKKFIIERNNLVDEVNEILKNLHELSDVQWLREICYTNTIRKDYVSERLEGLRKISELVNSDRLLGIGDDLHDLVNLSKEIKKLGSILEELGVGTITFDEKELEI